MRLPANAVTHYSRLILSWLYAATVFLFMCPDIKAGSLTEAEDTTVINLSEVKVDVKLRIKSKGENGEIILSPRMLRNLPSFGGNPDIMRALQTMPLTTTSSDVSSGISVMGNSSQNNFYSIDNGRIINPLRFLGIFSTYNPSHFSAFHFSPVSNKAYSPNYLGAFIEASTSSYSPPALMGTATVGLINSSASLAIPLGTSSRTWIRLSGRISYIDKIYPGLLKLGHASLLYDFNDLNVTAGHRIGNDGVLKLNVFLTNDRLRVKDTYYDLRGHLSWGNCVIGMTYSDNRQSHSLYSTSLRNKFRMTESMAEVDLPSDICEYGYDGLIRLSDFTIGANVIYRNVLLQHNPNSDIPESELKNNALEISVSGDYLKNFGYFELGTGLRMTYYASNGFSRVYPLPRLTAGYKLSDRAKLSINMSRVMQFSHLIEESNGGLPCNFWINADKRFGPRKSSIIDFRYDGGIKSVPINWSITAFWRNLSNVTEFGGNILNIINSGYEAMDDIFLGKGHSYGVSVMLSAELNKFDGWITYNISRSKLKIPALRDGWFPASFDRCHDLKVNLNYLLSDSWSISSTIIYATGLPFTKAEYGYMLGENLLCHYYPHNSSRLPDYFRVDFGASWRFLKKAHCTHRLDLSVMNATCHRNVLMMNYHYSGKDGFSLIKSGLHSPIPSISYTIDF